MRDCGESDAREGQEPSDVIGSTQGGQPSDVPGGHPASLAWQPPKDAENFLDYEVQIEPYGCLGVPPELMEGGSPTLAQEQMLAAHFRLAPWRSARKEAFDDFIKDIPELYGNSEAKPDEQHSGD